MGTASIMIKTFKEGCYPKLPAPFSHTTITITRATAKLSRSSPGVTRRDFNTSIPPTVCEVVLLSHALLLDISTEAMTNWLASNNS